MFFIKKNHAQREKTWIKAKKIFGLKIFKHSFIDSIEEITKEYVSLIYRTHDFYYYYSS